MSKITKIVTVGKGEEKAKAVEIAAFYDEQRAAGNRVSRATVSSVGDAINITVYADELGDDPSDIRKECAIIRVERGNENAGAAEISKFYNEQQALGNRTSRAIMVPVEKDMVYVIFADVTPDASDEDEDTDETDSSDVDDSEDTATDVNPADTGSDSSEDIDYFD